MSYISCRVWEAGMGGVHGAHRAFQSLASVLCGLGVSGSLALTGLITFYRCRP